MKYFITLVLLPAAALAMTMPLSNMAAYKVAAEPRDSFASNVWDESAFASNLTNFLAALVNCFYLKNCGSLFECHSWCICYLQLKSFTLFVNYLVYNSRVQNNKVTTYNKYCRVT